MKKVKNISAQEWLPINYIYSNGIIKINKNKYIKILKIIPINYNLKSDLEKHIFNIEKNISQKENNYLNKISKNYINYIKKINSLNKASTKDFYIIICNNINNNYENLNEIIENDLKEKYFKIKECLNRCGNDVYEIIDSNEIINLFYSFLNTRENLNNN